MLSGHDFHMNSSAAGVVEWSAGRSFPVPWASLSVLALFYIVLFLAYYPETHGIEDEVGFANQAVVWSKGVITSEAAGLGGVPDFVERNDGHVGWRNPGRPLLVIPMLITLGYRSIFLSGAIIHLGLVIFSALILQSNKKSPLWAALVLGHPTLAVYSRTIMGDAPAALGLLVALWLALTRPRPGIWCGLALGIATLMRYQVAVIVPFFVLALASVLPSGLRWREMIRCGVAAGSVLVGIAIYNWRVLGNVTGSVGQGYFSIHSVAGNLVFYGFCLLVVWPLMLIAPVLDRTRTRWLSLSIVGPFLVFLLPYYFHDTATSWMGTLIIGQRLLIPAIPVLVLSYAAVLETNFFQRLPRRVTPVLVLAGCTILSAVQVELFRQHQRHLKQLAAAQLEFTRVVPPGSLVISNRTLSKLFEVPAPGVPSYRWRLANYFTKTLDYSAEVNAERQAWYYALLLKPGTEPRGLADYRERYVLNRIPTQTADLIIYRAEPVQGVTGP